MHSGTIILSLFVGSALFLAIWAQSHANPHHASAPASHVAAPDPSKPYLALWRKRGHNAVKYQYNMHKPVQNGHVDQHGSVTLFKPPHKDNQPDQSGFMVSYRISQDFDSNKPGGGSHGPAHGHVPAHAQSRPAHHAPTQPQHHNNPYGSGTHCYDTINSNQVFCCSPSHNGGHQRCWRQNNGWEGMFF